MAKAILLHGNAKDLTGFVYDRLTVLRPVRKGSGHGVIWECKCECGNISEVSSTGLKNGFNKSCGCKWRCSGAQSKSSTYGRWHSMISRCTNHKSDSYPSYGGRGIKVCDRWMDFGNFFADIGVIPKDMSLERIDVNGDYCPENCTIIPMKRQARNRRNTLYITHFGERIKLADLADKTELSYGALYARYRRGARDERLIR